MAAIRTQSNGDSLFSVAGSPRKTKEIELFHEWSATPRDSTIEEIIHIDPLAPPGKIIVRSKVISSQANSMVSPDYLATKRRRASKKLLVKVRALDQYCDTDNFAVWTQAILDDLRAILRELSTAEQYSPHASEGNAREIMAQLRDSLLNHGWHMYRKHEVRMVVEAILNDLATLSEIVPRHATSSFERLMNVNLNPVLGVPLLYDEEAEVSD